MDLLLTLDCCTCVFSLPACFIIWHLSNGCLEKAVRAVIRGRGGLFDLVNQTGTRTQVRGAPINKKQFKSGQIGTGMQHEIWSE